MASTSATEKIIKNLCMSSVQVKHNPDCPNIFLACQQMPNSQSAWNNYLQEDADLLKSCRLDTQQRVYFCRTIEMTCRLYEYFEAYLGEVAYIESSSYHLTENRLLAMYHSVSAKSVKEAVMHSLSDVNGTIRQVP